MTTTTLTRSAPAETTAEYSYDYTGQDPINNYDLDGTMTGPIGGGLAFTRSTICTWYSQSTCPRSGVSVALPAWMDATIAYAKTHKTQLAVAAGVFVVLAVAPAAAPTLATLGLRLVVATEVRVGGATLASAEAASSWKRVYDSLGPGVPAAYKAVSATVIVVGGRVVGVVMTVVRGTRAGGPR